MEAMAEPVGRVPRRENANVMTAIEQLLGKRLYVPVDTPLVGPGIG